MSTGSFTREVHAKARLLHDQIAALSTKALESTDPAIARLLCAPYYQLLDHLYEDELPWARAMDDSDMVVRLKGPSADQEAPRVGLFSDTLDLLREQVYAIAKSLMHALPESKIPRSLDLGLSAVARGSIVLGLKVRAEESEADLFADVDRRLVEATRNAVRKLGEVARYVDEEGVKQGISEWMPDPAMRDIVLSAASKIAPTGRRGVETVELIHPGVRAGLPMTPRTRSALRQALARPVPGHRTMEVTGIVRELDLDLMRFDLRQIAGIGNLRCAYVDIPEEQARAMLGSLATVRGTAAVDESGRARLLQVDRVQVLRGAAQGELPIETPTL